MIKVSLQQFNRKVSCDGCDRSFPQMFVIRCSSNRSVAQLVLCYMCGNDSQVQLGEKITQFNKQTVAKSK